VPLQLSLLPLVPVIGAVAHAVWIDFPAHSQLAISCFQRSSRQPIEIAFWFGCRSTRKPHLKQKSFRNCTHVHSSSRIILRIALAGTQVRNRGAGEGGGAGSVALRWRDWVMNPQVRALRETKGNGPVLRWGKNAGGAWEPRHILN
jgi:hypothetical protein